MKDDAEAEGFVHLFVHFHIQLQEAAAAASEFIDSFWNELPAGDGGGCICFLPSRGCAPERSAEAEQPWQKRELEQRGNAKLRRNWRKARYRKNKTTKNI